jgi:hypothetical protein
MFMKPAAGYCNETAASGDDLLRAAAQKRLAFWANSSASGVHTQKMEARCKAKIL